ncbi:MAG: PilZ domain-containing protein [Candidatus Omnitrophota bacterium]|nr:PilZ domain-containing protein [Candidatus Omnitrophota bacterium]
MQLDCSQKINEHHTRRMYARYPVEADAILFPGCIPRQFAKVIDLSVRGARVVSTVPLEINHSIEIAVSSLLEKPINLQARVVWSNQVNEHLWQSGLDFGSDSLIDLRDFCCTG